LFDQVKRIGSSPSCVATIILVAVPERHADDARTDGRIDHRLDLKAPR
jgi:hypothetical protein